MIKHHTAQHSQGFFITVMHSRSMEIGSTIVFTHAHHHHLDKPTTDRVTEIIGVWLHTVKDHDAIGRECHTAGKGGDSIRRTTDFASLHCGLYGHPHGFLSNAVIRKDSFLPFRRSSPMATHGWHNKRLHPGSLQFTKHREHDLLEIGNTATTHGESHPLAGCKTTLNHRDLFGHSCGNLQGIGLGKLLPHGMHPRQGTGIE